MVTPVRIFALPSYTSSFAVQQTALFLPIVSAPVLDILSSSSCRYACNRTLPRSTAASWATTTPWESPQFAALQGGLYGGPVFKAANFLS